MMFFVGLSAMGIQVINCKNPKSPSGQRRSLKTMVFTTAGRDNTQIHVFFNIFDAKKQECKIYIFREDTQFSHSLLTLFSPLH